jgi:hypothetical protein
MHNIYCDYFLQGELYLFRNIVHTNTHICMSTHPNKDMYAHPTPMNTFERLVGLILIFM